MAPQAGPAVAVAPSGLHIPEKAPPSSAPLKGGEIFVYQVTGPALGVRNRPDTGDGCRTGIDVAPGALRAFSARQDTVSINGDGPFLKLSDGSGWLFEQKGGTRVMQPLQVSKAYEYCIINTPSQSFIAVSE